MVQQLQTLKRACQHAPNIQIQAEPSMTLSFKLPASYIRQRNSKSNGNKHVSKFTTTQSTNSYSKDEKLSLPIITKDSENSESWEERSWDLPNLTQTEVLKQPRSDNDEEVDNNQHIENGVHSENLQWDDEKLTLPDLPDDFPVLIVNISRLKKEHFNINAYENESNRQQIFTAIKTTIQDHYSDIIEVLFEQQICYHTTYGESEAYLNYLRDMYPYDDFALIDYPTEIDGQPLSIFLFNLDRITRWKSVNAMKSYLRQCSRDIQWKSAITEELEALADQEQLRLDREQESLRNEIDMLIRLRESFQMKLHSLPSSDVNPLTDTSNSSQLSNNKSYMLLRKLEDIEFQLSRLLERYVPTLESEFQGDLRLLGLKSQTNKTKDLEESFIWAECGPQLQDFTVIDKVIAMILNRLPIGAHPTAKNGAKIPHSDTELQSQELLQHHLRIRRLWKNDFGQLPAETVEINDIYENTNEQLVGDNMEEKIITVDKTYEVEGQTPKITDCEDSGQSSSALDLELRVDGYSGDKSSDSDSNSDINEHPRIVHKSRSRNARPKRSKTLSHTIDAKKVNIDAEDIFQPFACIGALGMLRDAMENERF